MAKQKIDQEALLEGLREVFRKVGYEGASMELLAESTGLRKSSLYHRFPGGKKEMAVEVMDSVCSRIRTDLLEVVNSSIDKHEKLTKVIENISALYRDGQANCILRTLSMDNSDSSVKKRIMQAFKDWQTGLTRLGIDFGFRQDQAARLAQETIIKIQGSLVVSSGLNDPTIFQRVLDDIESIYKG